MPLVHTLVRAGRLLTVGPLGTITDGAVAVSGRNIAAVGPWSVLRDQFPQARVLDAGGLTVTPGLVDCHTHNIEFGPGTMWGIGQRGQFAGAGGLLLDALQAGVTALGEHVLGHYAFRRSAEEYRTFANLMPQTIRFAVGTCVVGTEPITCLCALNSGEPVSRSELLDEGNLREMAAMNEFPGENIIVTATVANLPVEMAPHAGRKLFTRDELARVVRAYRAAGRRIGAHLEGPEAISDFLDLKGDVIHHGHGLPAGWLPRLAAQGVLLCATPSGGTSRCPNSPAEIRDAVAAGVTVAISTDAVLPVHPEADWYDLPSGALVRSSQLMELAAPAMRLIREQELDENAILALITLNGAQVLGLAERLGSIEVGKQADLVFARGIPGLEITTAADVRAVMLKGDLAVGGL